MDKHDEAFTLMLRFGRAMAKYVLVDRKPFDFGIGMELYPVEIHLLSVVHTLDGVGVTELAREFDVTKGAISQQVSRLVDKGLLTKERDPENKSRVIIAVTELGRRASEEHKGFHQIHDRAFLDYLAALDPESRAAVEGVADQLHCWMDNYLK